MVKHINRQEIVSFGEDMLGLQYFDRIKSATTLQQKILDVFEGVGTLALTTTSFGGTGVVTEDVTKYVLERRGYSVETSLLRKIIAPPKTDFETLLQPEITKTFSGRTAFGKLTHDVFGQSFDNVLLNERRMAIKLNMSKIQVNMFKIKNDVRLQQSRFESEEDVTFEMLERMNIVRKTDRGTYEIPEEKRNMVQHAQQHSTGMPNLYGFGEFNKASYSFHQQLVEQQLDEFTILNFIQTSDAKNSLILDRTSIEEFQKMYSEAYGQDAPKLTYKLYKTIAAVGRPVYASGGRGTGELTVEQIEVLKQTINDVNQGQEFKDMFDFILNE